MIYAFLPGIAQKPAVLFSASLEARDVNVLLRSTLMIWLRPCLPGFPNEKLIFVSYLLKSIDKSL
jgi:hypothetical protein